MSIFRVYMDGALFYHPQMSKLAITDARIGEDAEKRDAVIELFDQLMVRRRKIERFIESVKDLPELITEFDESLWAGLVDSMTVHSKDRIVFRLTCGMEIAA